MADTVVTTLGHVIAAVPQLANACSSAMTTVGDIPGFGLKLMRLVNKQLGSAMLGVVSGYTLTLDGEALLSDKELSFLAATKLSYLRARVIAEHLREYLLNPFILI